MVSKDENITTAQSESKGSWLLDVPPRLSIALLALALGLSFWLYWDGLAAAVLRWELQE